jgi:hypothetical protein
MNLLLNIPPEVVRGMALREPAPAGFSDREKAAYDQLKMLPVGYFIEQGTRPRPSASALPNRLSDSPRG